MKSGGFVQETGLSGCDVFSDAVYVHLEDEDEDLAGFGSVAFDETNRLVVAAGGTSTHTLSVLKLDDLPALMHATPEEVRGALHDLSLDPKKRHGINRIAIPRGSAAGGNLGLLYSSDNGWDHSVKLGVERGGMLTTVRYFNAHRDKVTSLVPLPHWAGESSIFLSTAEDGTVCLWSRDHSFPMYRWRTRTSPAAAFDSTGTVVAITESASTVHLYDMRMLRKNVTRAPTDTTPFASMDSGLPLSEQPLSLEFHPYSDSAAPKENLYVTGEKTLSKVSTTPNGYTTRLQTSDSAAEPSGHTILFPDGCVALRASADGTMNALDTNTGGVVHSWGSAATGFSGSLRCGRFSQTQWSAVMSTGRQLVCIMWPYNLDRG